MKVIAEWLELKVKQYEDGEFEAYEALTDTSRVGTWAEVRDWIMDTLLPDTEAEIEEAK